MVKMLKVIFHINITNITINDETLISSRNSEELFKYLEFKILFKRKNALYFFARTDNVDSMPRQSRVQICYQNLRYSHEFIKLFTVTLYHIKVVYILL